MSFELNTRQKAVQAQKQARPNTTAGSQLPELSKALILAANGDGWDCCTLDAAGNKGRIFQRVFSHPAESTFTQLQEVWLHIPRSGESPTILVAGGGGTSSTCMQSATQWAAYFD